MLAAELCAWLLTGLLVRGLVLLILVRCVALAVLNFLIAAELKASEAQLAVVLFRPVQVQVVLHFAEGGTMPIAASAIYFLNLRGDVLINRLYRDDVG